MTPEAESRAQEFFKSRDVETLIEKHVEHLQEREQRAEEERMEQRLQRAKEAKEREQRAQEKMKRESFRRRAMVVGIIVGGIAIATAAAAMAMSTCDEPWHQWLPWWGQQSEEGDRTGAEGTV